MLHHSSAPVKIPRTPQPEYSPLGVRACTHCRRTDRWRQVWAIGGGWLCCPSRALLDANRDVRAHACSPLCALGGVA